MTDFWTSKDSLNVIIAIVIGIITGIITSFIATFYYERLINRRKKNELFNRYSFLQSIENNDWQHWDIDIGKIKENPIESFMTLKYEGGKTFSFTWGNKTTGEKGSGFIFWDEVFHGKMSFFLREKNWFGYRDVYHEKITYQGKEYNAIFVNADDQKAKYVMLRPL